MSENTMEPDTADMRRAAALIRHYGSDPQGAVAVMDEALETDRFPALLMGVCELYAQLIPQLATPLGQRLLGDAIVAMAAKEADNGDGID